MKLGEALSLRAKQANKLNDLRGRIKSSVLTQEGAAPAEDPAKLVDEFISLSDEHKTLLTKIATANATTLVGERTLLELLHDREDLIRQRNMYSMAAEQATGNTSNYRYLRTELKFVANISVADYRVLEDKLNEAVRKLDAMIQQVNWETDL